MRLNRRSEIAIAILAACARTPARTMRTVQVAEIAKASKDHTAQVVCSLVQAGFLRAERGRNGGIRLAVPAWEILLGDVLRRMQPAATRYSEPTGAVDTGSHGHAFASINNAANATYLSFLDRFSIADLVVASMNKGGLCLEHEMSAPANWIEERPQQDLPVVRQVRLDNHQDGPVRFLVAEQAKMGRSRNGAVDFA